MRETQLHVFPIHLPSQALSSAGRPGRAGLCYYMCIAEYRWLKQHASSAKTWNTCYNDKLLLTISSFPSSIFRRFCPRTEPVLDFLTNNLDKAHRDSCLGPPLHSLLWSANCGWISMLSRVSRHVLTYTYTCITSYVSTRVSINFNNLINKTHHVRRARTFGRTCPGIGYVRPTGTCACTCGHAYPHGDETRTRLYDRSLDVPIAQGWCGTRCT